VKRGTAIPGWALNRPAHPDGYADTFALSEAKGSVSRVGLGFFKAQLIIPFHLALGLKDRAQLPLEYRPVERAVFPAWNPTLR
jgi:hypothetical protein